MVEYKIRKSDLGYIITMQVDDVVLYRTGKEWNRRKSYAKTYLFRDDALSGLIIAKCRKSE